MTTNEAYQKYIIELQANGTTDNIQSTRSRFVVNYNKAQNKVIEWLIERKNEDDNRYLQSIKKIDSKLEKNQTSEDKDTFLLKSDYFDFINLNAFATSGKCRNQRFFLKEVKSENLNNLLDDYNTKPSFKYSESFFIISDNLITLFKEDFTFDTAYLSYYRYPKQIKLENLENPDSELVDEILEFDDKLIDRIITLAASEHSLNANDPKYAALKQQVLQKI